MYYKHILNSNSGMIQIYVLSLLSVFMVTGMAMLDLQDSSFNDFQDMRAASQARFLASSALQEGRYFVMKMDANYTGTSFEQSVTVDGKKIGTYEFNVSRLGRTFTITGIGYVPDKSARRKVSHTLTSKFTYDYFGVGVVLLSNNSSGALTMSGNAKINVLGGKLVVNSSSATGMILSQNAKIKAAEIDLVGGYSGSGITGTIKTGVQPVADPLADLPAPDPIDLALTTQSTSKKTISGTQTLQPGVYTGGLNIKDNANVTLAPGIYYIDGGGFSVTGNANVFGEGVMIYNLPRSPTDQLNIGGNGSVNLSGPTAGTYRNVTLYQQRESTVSASVGGNGTVQVSGDFYFPSSTLNLIGNSRGSTLGSLQIASQMNISGNGTITVNADSP